MHRERLTITNIHNTGHLHGILPLHVGMKVRLTAKLCASRGLVPDAEGTVVAMVCFTTPSGNNECVTREVPDAAWVRMDAPVGCLADDPRLADIPNADSLVLVERTKPAPQTPDADISRHLQSISQRWRHLSLPGPFPSDFTTWERNTPFGAINCH
jgi:hypothetical protein